MEKVLLAIDGMTPEQKAFRYALSLCKRIRAELSIFQIIRPQHYREYKKMIQNKAAVAKKFFEGSMMAATFAEAGEHEVALDIMNEATKEIRRLVQASKEAGVHCHFSVKTGNPEREIVNYVNDHRNVVLTIYDAADAAAEDVDRTSRKINAIANIKNRLSVPLITVQS
jgi:nucleotide-binding universal stress UspA family protein